MLHSTFHLPFNKSKYLSLKGEKLDELTEHCEQLCVLLIDEASLIGSTLLYQVEKYLRDIKHTPLVFFGNIDVIFLGDLFQVQPIKGFLIFEKPFLAREKPIYDLWKDKVKCYELCMTKSKKYKNIV